MKVFGLNHNQVTNIAKAMTELEVSNVRETKTSVAFKLTPTHSDSVWARKSAQGRRLKAANYDAWRVFITLCFKLGANRVQTMAGDWTSLDQFNADLPRLARLNNGSIAVPAPFITLGRHPRATDLDLVRLSVAALTVANEPYYKELNEKIKATA